LKRYLVNLILAMLPPTRWFALKRFLWKALGVSVGNGTKINSGARIWDAGNVTVGDSCWLGMNFTVIVPAGASVTIGADVDIAPDVLIECGSHEIGGPDRRAGKGQAADVAIGSGTWIGCRATLLGGARLGPGTVVAAGAVVLPGDYPANALLAGVPARVSRILDANGG
jgi:acetyltransferase-like isoleucine patch superfamily enzyme